MVTSHLSYYKMHIFALDLCYSQVHMLLLPFLPITALIMQNATTLSTLLTYQVCDFHGSYFLRKLPFLAGG